MEFEVQENRGREIEGMVRAKLTGLMQQLESLPLEEGDTSQLIERMQSKKQKPIT